MRRHRWRLLGVAAGALLLGVAALVLRPGPAPVPELRPTLTPMPPPPQPPVRSGLVLDDEEQPVAGARVLLVPAPAPLETCRELLFECACDDEELTFAALERALAPRFETRSDDDGGFTLPAGLAQPGDRVVALAGDRGGATTPTEAPFAVHVAERGAQVLAAGTTPLAGVPVLGLREGRVTWVARSDAAGRVLVPDAEQRLAVAPGFPPALRDDATGDLRLEPGVTFSGVLREGRQPRGAVRLEARIDAPDPGDDVPDPSDGARCAWTTTAGDGAWTLGPLRTHRSYRFTAVDGDARATTVLYARGGVPEVASDLDLAAPATVTGVVVEASTGTPVPGARVLARAFGSKRDGPRAVVDHPEVETDAVGRFTLTVSPGEVSLTAERRGYATAGGPFGRPLLLAAGQVAEVRLGLRGQVPVSGRVADGAGRAVPGARVRCSSREVMDEGGSTVGDAQGAFVLDCTSGPSRLEASAPGHRPATLETVAPASEQRLTLLAAVSVSGRVLDEARRPAPRVRVTLSGAQGLATAMTDADGRFEVKDGVWDGQWTASALVEGPSRPRETPMSRRAVAQAASVDFEVRDGRAPELELVLAAGRALEGRALDAAGRPVAGLGIRAEHGAAAAQADPVRALKVVELANRLMEKTQGRFAAEATTDEAGAFRLEGLEAGPWTLRAWSEQWRDDPRAPTVVQGGERDVVLRVVARPLVRGVVRSASGAALRELFVAHQPVERPGGEFLLPLSGGGRATVSVRAKGHVPLELQLDAPWGATLELGELRLEPARALTLSVVDAKTAVGLAAFVSQGGVSLPFERAQGLVEGVSLGDTELRVSAPDYEPVVVPVARGQASLAVALRRSVGR